MANILLAEDDENLGYMIQDNLHTLGHEIIWAKNGIEALTLFEQNQFDLCLIDVMMPRMDGFELAEKIRLTDEFIPILFLTAKSLEVDRLTGFEVGGDDYILKPFSMKELDYRINVFLKRSNPTDQSHPLKMVSFGESTFDPVNLIYVHRNKSIGLTQMEGSLLSLLLQHKNNLVRREDILEKIWGENDYFKGRSLDVFITRLRKYLKEDELIEIKNHHGVGFFLIEK